MVNNPFSLEGKTILVTGASSGIGRGICIQCSKMGAKVVLTGRNQERLNETISMMEGEGHISLAYDLTNNDNVAAMVDECPELNGIVHCAGVSQIVMAKKLNYEAIDDIFKTNVYAPLNLNATLLKKKKVAKGSSIVFISPISGVYATNIGESGYAATKAALLGYVKASALELAAQKIRVNSIHPGVVETPLLQVSNSTFSEENLENLKKKYPLKRFGQPEDIANSAVYLLSDASSWVTGSSILIDGGYSLN